MNAFYVPDLAGMIYAMPGMQTELNAGDQQARRVPRHCRRFTAARASRA